MSHWPRGDRYIDKNTILKYTKMTPVTRSRIGLTFYYIFEVFFVEIIEVLEKLFKGIAHTNLYLPRENRNYS